MALTHSVEVVGLVSLASVVPAAIVLPLSVYLTFSARGRCWAPASGTVCPDSQVQICVWTDDETSSLGHRSYRCFMEEEGA